MGQPDGFLPSPCLWPCLAWTNMVGVGQAPVKAAPFPEISREKDSTSSLGLAFLIHDPLSRKLTLVSHSVCPVSLFPEEGLFRPIAFILFQVAGGSGRGYSFHEHKMKQRWGLLSGD